MHWARARGKRQHPVKNTSSREAASLIASCKWDSISELPTMRSKEASSNMTKPSGTTKKHVGDGLARRRMTPRRVAFQDDNAFASSKGPSTENVSLMIPFVPKEPGSRADAQGSLHVQREDAASRKPNSKGERAEKKLQESDQTQTKMDPRVARHPAATSPTKTATHPSEDSGEFLNKARTQTRRMGQLFCKEPEQLKNGSAVVATSSIADFMSSPTKKRCVSGDSILEYSLLTKVSYDMERLIFEGVSPRPDTRSHPLFFEDDLDTTAASAYDQIPTTPLSLQPRAESCILPCPAETNRLVTPDDPMMPADEHTASPLCLVITSDNDGHGSDTQGFKKNDEDTQSSCASEPREAKLGADFMSDASDKVARLPCEVILGDAEQSPEKQFILKPRKARVQSDHFQKLNISVKTPSPPRADGRDTSPDTVTSNGLSKKVLLGDMDDATTTPLALSTSPVIYGTKSRDPLIDDDDDDDEEERYIGFPSDHPEASKMDKFFSSPLTSAQSDSVVFSPEFPRPPTLKLCRSASLCNDDLELLGDFPPPPDFVRQSSSQVFAN